MGGEPTLDSGQRRLIEKLLFKLTLEDEKEIIR